MTIYNNKKTINLEVCWKSAEQLVLHKQKQGYNPKSIFIEENAHIFREPNWEDVKHLYYVRFLDQNNSFEDDFELEANSCK